MRTFKNSAKALIEHWAPALADRIHSHRADQVIRRKSRENGLAELEQRFVKEHGCTVTGSVFAGMIYLPEDKGSMLIPKLLGT